MMMHTMWTSTAGVTASPSIVKEAKEKGYGIIRVMGTMISDQGPVYVRRSELSQEGGLMERSTSQAARSQ